GLGDARWRRPAQIGAPAVDGAGIVHPSSIPPEAADGRIAPGDGRGPAGPAFGICWRDHQTVPALPGCADPGVAAAQAPPAHPAGALCLPADLRLPSPACLECSYRVTGLLVAPRR